MITTKYGFYQRYVRKHQNQRVQLRVFARSLPEVIWKEHGFTSEDDILTLNGILVTVWRGACFDGGFRERPDPLHRMTLELRDVVVRHGTETSHALLSIFGRRRRDSRKVRKPSFNHIRIALDEVIWPSPTDGRASGFRYGIERFFATGLLAPGVPPENQKTDAAATTKSPRRGMSPATLEAGAGDDRAQGGPNAAEENRRKVEEWFGEVRRRLRDGDHVDERVLDRYHWMVSELKSGTSFRDLVVAVALQMTLKHA